MESEIVSVVSLTTTEISGITRLKIRSSGSEFLKKPFPKEALVLKTLCEKEKLLVTSNFSFSHSVVYPLGQLAAIFINFTVVVYNLEESKICRLGND